MCDILKKHHFKMYLEMTNVDNLIVFLLIIRVIFEIIKEATLTDI